MFNALLHIQKQT